MSRVAELSSLHLAYDPEPAFRAAFDAAPVGMALVGLDGRVQHANRALGRLVARTPDDLRRISLHTLFHHEDAHHVMRAVRTLAAGRPGLGEVEARLGGRGSDAPWVAISVALVPGELGSGECLTVHLHDVTSRKQREERLRHRADHDPLTGLANRARLDDRARRALEAVIATTAPALLLLDLDGFKEVNDALGHDAGDRLLIAVGQRLAACLRPGDLVARFGGDEFALLLDRTETVAETIGVASRAIDALRVPVPVGGREASISACVGIARAEASMRTAEEWLRAADAALYRAKATGAGTYALAGSREVGLGAPGTGQLTAIGEARMTAWLGAGSTAAD